MKLSLYYYHKVNELLNDNDTYSVVNKNPTPTIEKQLNNMLKKWHSKDFISDNEYFNLRSSDSNLPKTYGLSKLHKDGIPFRIIVSSINMALHPIYSKIPT